MSDSTIRLAQSATLDTDVAEDVSFRLDSGMTLSVAPRDISRRLGVRPHSVETFRLPDGSNITRDRGCVYLYLDEKIGAADFLFGEEGDCALLGSLALASLGLALNPLNRELIPLPMILAPFLGSPDSRSNGRKRLANLNAHDCRGYPLPKMVPSLDSSRHAG